ncbi:MAG: non-canonical purine NTP pyrophosphatase [Asgard group archaeon]|nr:non-canonical purine NTP pyrophosphatase [Asgard group archaeon]
MSIKNTLTFVTNNKEKIADIRYMLGRDYNIEIISDLDLIEIQSLSVEEVITYKAKQAFDLLKKPVIVSDSGLEIPALKNFPGALVKFVNETIGQKGIVKLLENIDNRKAYVIAAIAFCDNPDNVVVFAEKTEGTIAYELKGDGWFFDRIFIPKGENRTWAEIGREEKNKNSAFRIALTRMANYLLKKD